MSLKKILPYLINLRGSDSASPVLKPLLVTSLASGEFFQMFYLRSCNSITTTFLSTKQFSVAQTVVARCTCPVVLVEGAVLIEQICYCMEVQERGCLVSYQQHHSIGKRILVNLQCLVFALLHFPMHC